MDQYHPYSHSYYLLCLQDLQYLLSLLKYHAFTCAPLGAAPLLHRLSGTRAAQSAMEPMAHLAEAPVVAAMSARPAAAVHSCISTLLDSGGLLEATYHTAATACHDTNGLFFFFESAWTAGQGIRQTMHAIRSRRTMETGAAIPLARATTTSHSNNTHGATTKSK